MQLTEGLNGGLAGLSLLATCWLWAEPAPTAASALTLQQQEQQQLPVATQATATTAATATARIHVFPHPHPFPLCAFASTQPNIPARGRGVQAGMPALWQQQSQLSWLYGRICQLFVELLT